MSGRVVVLTGGVGGAKLVRGLALALEPSSVTAIVNTGDDFRHLGLSISPDIDTLLYTLSGKADPAKGWGRANESWSFMAAARSLGMPDWFQLGDGDLALHVDRSMRLAAGERLHAITRRHAEAWNVSVEMLPMSDDPVATRLVTDEGELAFQDYFVRRRCAPAVRAIRFEGAEVARPAPGVIERLGEPGLRAILIAPSNPYLSIDPILAVPGLREVLQAARAPVVAVSPLVGGKAVKGPTGKIMAELGIESSDRRIADHYAGLIDALLVDNRYPQVVGGIRTGEADILMRDDMDRRRVAEAALALCDQLGPKP
ncbi:MAG: 2-phospho-L-lactate transferase [Sphingomonadaceae bacterium]